MKTLTAFNAAAIDSLTVEPIRLMSIDLDGLTLYLCDRAFGQPGGANRFGGNVYEPLIVEFGGIKANAVDPVTYESDPSDTYFVIMNDVPVGGALRFTELFATYDPQSALVTIGDIFPGAGSGDLLTLFKGTIEDLTALTRGQVTVTCAGFELDIVNRFRHTIADATTYPACDPDDVGKMLPQIYGEAKRVPTLAIDAGGKTTVAEEMTATSPGNGGTLEISDGTAFPTGAFICQIDSEQISIASRSGNVLTLAATGARGYASTDAVAHDIGAPIAEIQTEYVYLLADHAVSEIGDVYVDEIRQPTVNKFTGKPGDEHLSYPGKAIISFDTLPLYLRQINAEILDTIDVNDSIDVDQGSHGHGALAYATFNAETILSGGGIEYPERIPGASFETQAFMTSGDAGRFGFMGTKNLGGTPKRWRVGFGYRRAVNREGGRIRVQFDAGADTITQTSSNPGDNGFHTTVSGWSNCSASWANISGGRFEVDYYSGDGMINCCWVMLDIEYEPARSPADGVLKTGAASKIGTVTLSGNSTAETVIGDKVSADVKGYIDDASGSITGTPNRLIERADHVARHVITDRCGLTGGEIDSTSYANAGAFLAAQGFKIGFPILEKPNVRETLNRVAYQSKCLEFWDAGKHYLVAIEDKVSPDKVIDSNRIDQGQIYLSYTDRVDILNKLSATFGRFWSGYTDKTESDQSVVKAEDAASIATYGERQAKPLSFPSVLDSAQAQALIDWRIDEAKAARLMVELSGGYFFADLNVGDVVTFPVENDFAINDAALGLIISNAEGFRVIEKKFRSDAAIQFKCVLAGVVDLTSKVADLNVVVEIDPVEVYSPDMRVDASIDGDLTLTQKHIVAIDDLTVKVGIDDVIFSNVAFFILTEAGDFILTEDGDKIKMASADLIVTEDGDNVLTETGDNLATET